MHTHLLGIAGGPPFAAGVLEVTDEYSQREKASTKWYRMCAKGALAIVTRNSPMAVKSDRMPTG